MLVLYPGIFVVFDKDPVIASACCKVSNDVWPMDTGKIFDFGADGWHVPCAVREDDGTLFAPEHYGGSRPVMAGPV